jgi:hypothetical protein
MPSPSIQLNSSCVDLMSGDLQSLVDRLETFVTEQRVSGTHTNVAGIDIPSTAKVFLSIVLVHICFGLACVISGASTMLMSKRSKRHPAFGKFYFWCLAGAFATSVALSGVRWSRDYGLAILGTLSFSAALVGRLARQRRWLGWVRTHIIGMGSSYVLLLTAFYVDNGKSLPFWKELSPIWYWLLPSVVGVPIIIFESVRHPLARNIGSLDPAQKRGVIR